MNFDKDFLKLSKLVQFVLLILPVVGTITEVLVRVSALLRKKDGATLLGCILAFIPLFHWVDLAWIILYNRLFLQ
jgi:hypothetical protein